MTTIRILHASDFHLAATPYQAGTMLKQSSHDPNVQRAFAVFSHRMTKEIDAMVVTGDLATTGRDHDLLAAKAFFTYPSIASTLLTPAGDPTLFDWHSRRRLDLLPGNHDRYRSSARLYRPGGTRFDAVFGKPHWSSKQGAEVGLTFKKGKYVLSIIKADFSLLKNDGGKAFYRLVPGWLGQGRVRDFVIHEMVNQTGRVKRDVQSQGYIPYIIWAIHFDPLSTDAILQLLHAERLAEAAKREGVQTVLCGHTHESKITPLSDVTTVYACGSTCQASASHNDCQILEIAVPDSPPVEGMIPLADIVVRWYRYDQSIGQFRFLSSR